MPWYGNIGIGRILPWRYPSFFVYVVPEHSKGAYPCQSSLSAGRKVVNPKHCKLHLEHFSQRPGLVFPTPGTRVPNAREQSVQPIGLKRFHVSSV